MGPLKKHLTPLSKGGQIVKHNGKGAAPFPQKAPLSGLTQAAPSMNNYAKASPMPMPQPPPNMTGDMPDDTMTGQGGGI